MSYSEKRGPGQRPARLFAIEIGLLFSDRRRIPAGMSSFLHGIPKPKLNIFSSCAWINLRTNSSKSQPNYPLLLLVVALQLKKQMLRASFEDTLASVYAV